MYEINDLAPLVKPLLALAGKRFQFGISTDAQQALCGCINAHQQCIEWDAPLHFDYDVMMAGQDYRYPRLTIMRLLSAVGELTDAGLILPDRYHYRLAPALAFQLTTTPPAHSHV